MITFDEYLKVAPTLPQSLHARHAVSLAPQVPAESADHPHRLSHRRGREPLGKRTLVSVGAEHPPFVLGQDLGAGCVGLRPSPLPQREKSRGDSTQQSEQLFDPLGGLQLRLFDPASAFQDAVEVFDQPAELVGLDHVVALCGRNCTE